MSAAVASSHQFGDFGDTLFMNNYMSSKSHMKSLLLDRKTVGAPLGYATLSSAGSARRNSAATAAAFISAASLNFPTKITASVFSVNDQPNNNSSPPNNILNGSQQTNHRKLDRSFSEPVSSAVGLLGVGQQQQPANSSRYKTELCRPYEESGTCKYGDKCQFAHGGHELRTLSRHPKYKTELCRTFHTTGFCPYGPRCHFIHNADESRKSPPSSPPTSPPSSTCSSSDESDGSSSPPLSLPAGRPKAFSVGSYLSACDEPLSPSLSCSPTDDPFMPNNAFTYSSQDFTVSRLSKQMAVQQAYNRTLNRLARLNVNAFEQILVVERVDDDVVLAAAPSSVSAAERRSPTSDDDEDDDDNSSISRRLRLPIFSQLSVCDF